MKHRHGRKRSWPVTVIVYLLLLLAGAAAGFVWVDSLAYKTCRVEAGGVVKASDFIKNGDGDAYFAAGSDPFDMTVPGEYHVVVKSGFFSHKATLIIQDTVPPAGTPVKLKIPFGSECKARDLVTQIEDVTQVQCLFLEKPDFSRKGSQEVEILLTDAAGNSSRIQSELYISQTVGDLTWEAGNPAPGLEDFLISADTAEFVTDMSSINMNTVADYTIEIMADGYTYVSTLHVTDTVPPKAVARDVDGYALVERKPEDFISEVEDATLVTAAWQEEPDVTRIGTQEVKILLTDEGGNEEMLTAHLTLKEDTEPPVITGTRDIEILTGEGISYRRGVEVTDNCPEGLEFTIDSDEVNPDEEGTYQATYLAKDLAGNTASATITVTVRARKYSEEQINVLADEVLAEIITDDMTPLEKVEAIYTWNMSHIGYVSHSEKGDWTEAAYEGIVNHSGDCFVYASTAKVLLTRAGITNMDVEKIPGKTSHYWNLVDIGDGWYHLDTTPRKDHPRIFMWTDEQLMDYSAKHNNSHNYDHSLYPEVN